MCLIIALCGLIFLALLLTEALERLVQLYEALGKKDEAAKWRKELETAKAKLPVHP